VYDPLTFHWPQPQTHPQTQPPISHGAADWLDFLSGAPRRPSDGSGGGGGKRGRPEEDDGSGGMNVGMGPGDGMVGMGMGEDDVADGGV